VEDEDALNRLMESPLPPESGKRRRIWIVLAVGVVLAFVVGLVLRHGSEERVGASSDTNEVTTPATMTTLPQMVLVEYLPEPALLYHPTVLPLGWQKCRQLEDSSRGDRFCDPDQEDVWIQVAIRDATPVVLANAVPISDAHGAMWLSQTDPVEIAVPSGTFSLVVALGNRVDGEDLLAVVESIPLVSSRDSLYGSYELPLAMADLTEEQLAGLVAAVDENPRVVGQGDAQGDVQVYAAAVTLRAFPNEDSGTLPDFAATLSLPRLLVTDRPVVVGETPSRGRSVAVWDQRQSSWRLEGQMSSVEMEALVVDVIERIRLLQGQ
jgi:hypothetical protein